MFRSYSAACLAAAFGAVVIVPIHARCIEAHLPLPALVAVGLVAAIAASAWFIVMAMWDGARPSTDGVWRSTLAAFLAAAYGAVAIGSVYDRCLDAMVPAPDWLAVTFTAWSAALACLLIMLCRSPVVLAYGELKAGETYQFNMASAPCPSVAISALDDATAKARETLRLLDQISCAASKAKPPCRREPTVRECGCRHVVYHDPYRCRPGEIRYVPG